MTCLAFGISQTSEAQFLKKLGKALDKFLETPTTPEKNSNQESNSKTEQENRYINGIYQANAFDGKTEMPTPHLTPNTKVFTVDNDPAIYINHIYFSDGAGFVKTPDKKYFFVDTLGNVLFNFTYPIRSIDPYPYFQDGVCPVNLKNGGTGLINKKGEVIKQLPCYRITNFVEGVATGFVSTREGFSNQTYSVYFDTKGNQVFKNLTERVDSWAHIQPPRGFSEGLAAFYSYSKRLYGFIDTKGNMVIPPQFSQAQGFSEGLAAVKTLEGKWGFINKQGKMVLPAIYSTEPSYFQEGLAVIKKKDMTYCYIDTTGNIVFNGLADALPFYNGKAFIRKNDGQIAIINRQGKYLSFIKSNLNGMSLEKLVSYSPEGDILMSSCFITPMGDMILGAERIFYPFSDGLTFCVDFPNGPQQPGNVGCINRKGEFIFVFKESEF